MEFAIRLQRFFCSFYGFSIHFGQMLHDILGFFFEGLAHCALLRFQANDVNRLGFRKTARGYQRNTSGLGVLREIVGGTISTADAFDPTLQTQNKKLVEKQKIFNAEQRT